MWLDEYGPADDPAIVDPTLGTETSRRLRVMYMVRVAEGGLTPADYTDATGITHHTLRLATLARTASAAIDAGMVADKRPRLEWDRGNIDHVLAQAAIAPDRGDLTQLYDAIVALIGPETPYATETVAGLMELATVAEAQAGTDGVRAITPATLFAAAAVSATANRFIRRDAAGRAQVANPSVAADIATKGYVDGAIFPASALLSQNGYVDLPGGVTIQWGNNFSVTGGTTVTVSFPKAFSAAAWSVTVNESDQIEAWNSLKAHSWTSVNVSVYNDDVNTKHANYIAIGPT